MSRFLLYIGLFFLLFSCRSVGTAVESGATVSAKDYPYIEKFHKALRLKTTGRIDEAATLLEDCLAIRQDDDAVYYALASIEKERGNNDKYAEYTIKASELDPNNTWYTQELAYLFYEQGKYEESASKFEQLIELEPRNIDWMYGYSEALSQSGQEEKAIEAYNNLENRVGEFPDLYLQKFNLYMSLKKKKEAEQELLTAKGKFPKDPRIIANLVDFYYQEGKVDAAVNMLQELVKADPNNGRAHLMLAEVYNTKGDIDKSIASLKAAFRSTDIDVENKVRILTGLNRELPPSDPDLKELIEIVYEVHPDDPTIHLIRGDYFLNNDQDKKALKSYQTALEYNPSEFAIWNQVLILEYRQMDFERLYEDSKKCLSYFPTSSDVYLLQAMAANQLKKFDEVEDIVSAADLLVPSDDKRMKAELKGQLGEAYFGLNQTDEAIEAYEEALALESESNLIKNNYAYSLAKHQVKLERALALINQVLANSTTAQYVDTKGYIYFQKGEYEQSLKFFNEALLIDSYDAIIYEHAGDAEMKLNNKDKALEFWKKAQSISPNNKLLEKKITNEKYYAE